MKVLPKISAWVFFKSKQISRTFSQGERERVKKRGEIMQKIRVHLVNWVSVKGQGVLMSHMALASKSSVQHNYF